MKYGMGGVSLRAWYGSLQGRRRSVEQGVIALARRAVCQKTESGNKSLEKALHNIDVVAGRFVWRVRLKVNATHFRAATGFNQTRTNPLSSFLQFDKMPPHDVKNEGPPEISSSPSPNG